MKKINLPFGIDENDNWNYFSEESNAEGGVWPLSRYGVWHTGIHLKAKYRYSLLTPLIPGEIVASRICSEYIDSPFGGKNSSSFVLMRHKFFTGKAFVPFYILYSSLGNSTAVENSDFLEYETDRYRPLFFREWKLKDNVVDVIPNDESHVVAYYSDANRQQIKGYLNRDGDYIVVKTPNEVWYRKNKTDKCYLKKNNQSNVLGLTQSSVKQVSFARNTETTNSCSYSLYYDQAKQLPKLKFTCETKKYLVTFKNSKGEFDNTIDINKEIKVSFDSPD